MTEEKHLDEMKHIACIGCRHLMECNESIQERCGFMVLIEALYNEGYRKQSEGEWIQQPRPYEDEIVCSVCGANFNILDNCTEKFDYCPNCGAKMKGGSE